MTVYVFISTDGITVTVHPTLAEAARGFDALNLGHGDRWNVPTGTIHRRQLLTHIIEDVLVEARQAGIENAQEAIEELYRGT